MNLEEFKKHMGTINVPAGFTATFTEETYGKDVHHSFTMEKPDDIKIRFGHGGDGHTSFNTVKGWLTFDRRGVDDSFHWQRFSFEKDQSPHDLNAIIAEQIKRVEERRAYYATAITVPGLPGNFTVAPNGVEELKKRLNGKNGHLTFTPAGFGTGYLITKKPTRGCQFGEARAKPELETFLGHAPLYVSTMDCD